MGQNLSKSRTRCTSFELRKAANANCIKYKSGQADKLMTRDSKWEDVFIRLQNEVARGYLTCSSSPCIIDNTNSSDFNLQMITFVT